MRGGIPRSLRGARWAAGFLKQHRDDVVMTFPPRFVQSAMIALLGRSRRTGGSCLDPGGIRIRRVNHALRGERAREAGDPDHVGRSPPARRRDGQRDEAGVHEG